MGKLDGKTALVTGGGRGIGRGIVVEFAREGADVAINYRRDREAAEAAAAEVRALGRRAVVLQADVGEREAVEAMVAQAVELLGGLDVAVANSGVAARVATVAKTDPAEWRRVLTTDLDGAFWTTRAAIPHVVARKGVVLFISSIGADAAQAGGAPYHVAKAGVDAPAKAPATEAAGAGRRAQCQSGGGCEFASAPDRARWRGRTSASKSLAPRRAARGRPPAWRQRRGHGREVAHVAAWAGTWPWIFE